MRTLLVLIAAVLSLQALCQSSGQCTTNVDFEQTSPGTYTAANAVSGWSISSATSINYCGTTLTWVPGSSTFSVMATPVLSVPVLGILGHSPFGGTVVAQLGSYGAIGVRTKLSRTFTVSSVNPYFTYAVAGVFQNGGHYNCCEGPAFRINVRDCQGSLYSCAGQELNQPCVSSLPYNTTQYEFYTRWQVQQLDLSPYIGSCVTVEMVTNDCPSSGHYGVAYVDVQCASGMQMITPPVSVSYCQGPALLQATPGYSAYAWSSSTGTLSGVTNQSFYIVTNPQVGAAYQATLVSYAGCATVQSFVIVPTQVSVTAIGASPSCPMGSSGSASVSAAGNGSGYGYLWTNTSNSVVSTASVAQNLPPGIYSVQVSAQNSTLCGTSGATVQVGNNMPTVYTVPKPFCGNTAYFTTSGGSNFQWYMGTSPVSGTTGTAPYLAVSSPSNGSIVRLRYQSAQGCSDSITYVLWQALPSPSVSTLFSNVVCQFASNGQATVSLSPAGPNQVTGYNAFNVVSTGSTPSYSASVTNYLPNQFVISNLAASGTYSVNVFDGSCYVSASISVPTYSTSNLFTLTTVGSPSVCQGQNVVASVSVTNSQQGPFSYSWSPNTFISGSNTSLGALISPTTMAGSSLTIIYTVTVKPLFFNCPATRTLLVLVTNPPVPVIGQVPVLCGNSAPVTVSATPPGGLFSGSIYMNSSGVIIPALASPGTNPFTYSIGMNNCFGSASSSFMLMQPPDVQAAGDTLICSGKGANLSAGGANSYQWSGVGSGAAVTVSPAITSTFIVTGTSLNGCTDADTIVVNVTPQPSVSVTGNTPVCAGQSLVLMSSGAQKLFWLNGPGSPFYSMTPAATGNYTVLGVNDPGQCVDTLVVTVTVNPLPVLAVTGPDTICRGDLLLLQGSGAPSLQWNGLSPGSTYSSVLTSSQTFTLSGTSAAGCSSAVLHAVQVEGCDGILEGNMGLQAQLFPNPVNETLTVILHDAAHVKVFDAGGRLVRETDLFPGQHTISMSALDPGVYTFQLSNGSKHGAYRVVKN